VPYQVLLRMFIVDGFKRWQKGVWTYVDFETLKSTLTEELIDCTVSKIL
jgi:hypothetical protein